jgi:hypothetical protein
MSVTYGYPTEEDKAKWPSIEAEARRIELMARKKAEVSALEIKNLRKLYDGIAEMCVLLGVDVSKMTEDLTAVNAERAKLRAEIQALEKVK